MSKLFEEALAEAKAIRKTALENAKLALEETLTPKFQSMFSSKLQEMEDDGYEDETMDENKDEKEDLEEEIDFDTLSEVDDEKSENESEDEPEEESEEEDESEEESEEEDESEEEEKDVKDLSVDELKDVIRDVIQQELASEVTPNEGDLENNMDNSEMDKVNGETNYDSNELPDENEDDDINLDELLAELGNIDETSDNIDEAKKIKVKMMKGGSGKPKEVKKLEESLKLANKTVHTLRQELKEINLLNAKLIYLNKIFSSPKVLNESQKMKIIEKFDKATTVKEAKLVFETLMDSFKTKPLITKNPLKESMSFASKPSGVAPKKPIVSNVDETVARWKKLANIK